MHYKYNENLILKSQTRIIAVEYFEIYYRYYRHKIQGLGKTGIHFQL